MTVIKNGDSGDTLKINNEGQAQVLAETQPEARHNAHDGKAFIIASNFVTTPASTDEIGVLFIKNTSTTKPLHVGFWRTCEQLAGKWRLYKGGTVFDNKGTDPVPENMRIGNATVLDAAISVGTSTSTTINATDLVGTWIQGDNAHSIQPFEGSLILGANQTLTLTFESQAGAAADVCATIQVWQG